MSTIVHPGPISAPESEAASLASLKHLLENNPRPKLVSASGETIPLTETVYQLLTMILDQLQQGNAVSVVPYHKLLTTQEAADILDVSRSYLLKLIAEKQLPCTMVGTHRRIRFGTVMEYLRQRDAEELAAIDEIARLSQEQGQY